MGAVRSSPYSISGDDLNSLSLESNFTHQQIRQLYKRFKGLDKDRSGTLTTDELLAIPEFAMNPLSHRIISIFMKKQVEIDKHMKHNGLCNIEHKQDGIGFRAFVTTLAIFLPTTSKKEKIKFAFDIYDTRHNGVLNKNDTVHLLKLMTGESLNDEERRCITRQITAILGGNNVSFEEFSKVFDENRLWNKMVFY